MSVLSGVIIAAIAGAVGGVVGSLIVGYGFSVQRERQSKDTAREARRYLRDKLDN